MGTAQQRDEALKELATRKLEKDHELQSGSLLEFMKFFRENEKRQPFDENRHIKLICDKLEKVYS